MIIEEKMGARHVAPNCFINVSFFWAGLICYKKNLGFFLCLTNVYCIYCFKTFSFHFIFVSSIMIRVYTLILYVSRRRCTIDIEPKI